MKDHSSFIIHHPSFIIHHSSSIIHHSSFIIHHPSSIIHHPSQQEKGFRVDQQGEALQRFTQKRQGGMVCGEKRTKERSVGPQDKAEGRTRGRRADVERSGAIEGRDRDLELEIALWRRRPGWGLNSCDGSTPHPLGRLLLGSIGDLFPSENQRTHHEAATSHQAARNRLRDRSNGRDHGLRNWGNGSDHGLRNWSNKRSNPRKRRWSGGWNGSDHRFWFFQDIIGQKLKRLERLRNRLRDIKLWTTTPNKLSEMTTATTTRGRIRNDMDRRNNRSSTNTTDKGDIGLNANDWTGRGNINRGGGRRR